MTHSLSVQDLEYDLPTGRIATSPVQPRHSAKMLVVSESDFQDCQVIDLPQLLPENALLVVNETAVLPARFLAERKDTGGKVEGLFLEDVGQGWHVMLKSNGKLRAGMVLQLDGDVELTLLQKEGKHWICACSSALPSAETLARVGTTPIPPYILKARGLHEVQDQIDRDQYQTVYADATQCESVAAPTAGLHFDALLFEKLATQGIHWVPVTLHVGAGTFKGIETNTIEAHEMHAERWSVSQETLVFIKRAKEEGRAIIAVGTTTVRTLESLPPMGEWPSEGGLSGSTNLMIVPPFTFSLVDGLLTNFHLPKSTLLTLVAAKIGIDRLHLAYQKAIESGYRFYSFGDAMFILP